MRDPVIASDGFSYERSAIQGEAGRLREGLCGASCGGLCGKMWSSLKADCCPAHQAAWYGLVWCGMARQSMAQHAEHVHALPWLLQ